MDNMAVIRTVLFIILVHYFGERFVMIIIEGPVMQFIDKVKKLTASCWLTRNIMLSSMTG